jgi:hypothetical protein
MSALTLRLLDDKHAHLRALTQSSGTSVNLPAASATRLWQDWGVASVPILFLLRRRKRSLVNGSIRSGSTAVEAEQR